MKIGKLVLANVIHRPIRALVSILAISLEVAMILLVIGIVRGVVNDNADRQQGLGSDIIVRPANAPPLFYSTGSAVIPEAMAETLLQVEEVQAVTPLLFLAQMRGSWLTIYGIDVPSFELVSGRLEYLKGQGFSSLMAHEAIIDDLHAKSKSLGINDFFELKGERFKIVGIFRNGIGGRVYLPIRILQKLMDKGGQASTFLVKVKDTAKVKGTVRHIRKLISGITVTSMSDWVSLLRNGRPPVYDIFLRVVIGVAISIGSFACFLSMYTTITERTKEIGIFKSLGASKIYIVNLVLMEVLLLCLTGLVVGFFLTFIGQHIIQITFPTQHLVISFSWILRTVLFVLLSGIAGALYPAIKAAHWDPIQAIAHH